MIVSGTKQWGNKKNRIFIEKSPPPPTTSAIYLDKGYDNMETELTKTFQSLEYVSNTADVWTSHKKPLWLPIG